MEMNNKERVEHLIKAVTDIISLGAAYGGSDAALVAKQAIEWTLEEAIAEARRESAERLRRSPSNPRYRGKPWVEAQELIADDIERGREE